MDEFPDALRSAFEPRALLGRGANGTVYLVTRKERGDAVALKVLNSAASGQAAARLVQEAEILAQLDHPHICRLLQWGRGGGRVWLAMEALQGRSLRERLEQEGAYTSGQVVLFLAGQVAAGLEHAHAKGILHRDVKPENVFLVRDTRAGARSGGEVAKILDFGLAKALQGSSSSVRTRAGMILGTPSYMPPERVQGESAVPATDVYSLATLVYEMLAGVPPFHGPPVEVLRAQLEKAPPALPGMVPEEIAAAVLAGLEKDPARRPASPRRFAEALAAGARKAVERRKMEGSAGPDARSPLIASGERSGIEAYARETPTRLGATHAAGQGRSPRLEARREADTPKQRPAARDEPPPTRANRVEDLTGGAPAPPGADPLDSSRLDLPRGPRRTKRLRRSGATARSTAALVSRALTRMSLLDPVVRRAVLAGCVLVLVAWFLGLRLRGAGPPWRPEEVHVTPGVTGALVRWTTLEPQASLALVLPQGQRAPHTLEGRGREEPTQEHQLRLSGLRAGRVYTLWIADPDGRPHPVQSFPTANEFRVDQVRILPGDRLSVRLEGTPWFTASFRGAPPDAGEARVHTLRLPQPGARLPGLLVRTVGGQVREAKTFPARLLEAFGEELRRVDPLHVAEELLRDLDIETLSGVPADPEGEIAAGAAEFLRSRPDLARLWKARPYFEGLLRDPGVPDEAKIDFANALARFAVLDGLFEALGLHGADGTPRRKGFEYRELTRALSLLYPEVRAEQDYTEEAPPLAPAASAWLPVDANNMAPVGMSEELKDYYLRKIHVFFPSEKPPVEQVEETLVLGPPGEEEASRLGVVARASHPETVLFVRINRRVLVPFRWHVDDGAARGFGNLALLQTMKVNSVAPLRTRVVELPEGVLREGENHLRVWMENPMPQPDAWLPTVHGFYLRPGG